MPGILTRRQVSILAPYLEGNAPGSDGEWGLLCPLHDDTNRSASLNVNSGDWYCHRCSFGANVEYLTALISSGKSASTPNGQGRSRPGGDEDQPRPTITEGSAQGWHSALLADAEWLEHLTQTRGLTVETIERFQIGWGQLTAKSTWAYSIPIRNSEGEIVNVRWYDPISKEGRRKIWSVEGMGSPVIYPIAVLDGEDEVGIVEGEWDALLTIQNGFPCVTRTGAADVWKSTWNHYFDDKSVWICHDMDEKGQLANEKIGHSLRKHARDQRVVRLPYEIVPKHGQDLTDYFHVDGHTAIDFKELLGDVAPKARDPGVVAGEFVDVGVLDSFDAANAAKRLRMRVTITGKRYPTHLLPHQVTFGCTQTAGQICSICPMNEQSGRMVRTIDSHDPVSLEMMGATSGQMKEILRKSAGIMKCNFLEVETDEFRAVEELYVRPAVDRLVGAAEAGDYTNRRVVSVGRHDTLPNNTVEVVGSIFPNPRGQLNEFQAWELVKTETSVDRYEVTPAGVRLMKTFQPKTGERPLKRIMSISRDLSTNVTKIYGRPEMHALIDLTFHSVLQFNFGGSLVNRGWLECLIVGDTRTGKSEAADSIRRHYGAGELVSCESASFAGVVGGLQQFGSGKEWDITWGVIPINDRRLVILDEVSGLQPEEIAAMSSIRSSGEAQLTKIRSERTHARTRLLWLGNPRNGRMDDYTYGVQAIRPLIGNNEDIARFDLAMSVAASEVDPAEINRQHTEGTKHVYREEACRELLLWAWSRTADQVVWSPGAEAGVYAAALDLGERYVEDPPLIQVANVRVKVARLAVAMAARTFSTDETYENIVVGVEHVNDAKTFIDRLYGMTGFGYADASAEALKDIRVANDNYEATKAYLLTSPELAKFLRSTGIFRRPDLEDMLNMSKEQANGTISTLYQYRMIQRRGANIKLNPQLHDILRDLRGI